MKRGLLAGILFLLGPSLSSAPLSCFASFAALTGEADADLISKTYGQLLDSLGSGASQKTMRAMASRNPFEVPEQPEIDLGSLQLKLKEFEGMLRQKGWLTPEITQRLAADLVARSAKQDVAKDKANVAAVVAEPDRDLTLTEVNWSTVSQSPDGRYLLVKLDGPTGKFEDWTAELYDRRTHTLTRVPGNGQNAGFPVFSVDGREVLVPLRNGHQIQFAPFHEGKIDWAQSVTVGEGEAPGQAWLHAQGKSTDWFLAGDALKVFRYRRSDRTRVPVDIPRFIREYDSSGGLRLNHWQMVSGTDEVAVTYESRTSRHLMTAEIAADGKMNLLKRWATWDREGARAYSNATFTSGGRGLYLWNEESANAAYVDRPGATPQPLFAAPPAGPRVVDITTHPTGDEVAVLFRGGVEIRTSTGPGVYRLDLPGRYAAVRFSADGERLLVFGEPGEPRVRQVNFRQRTSP